ncbi:carbohydrate kinase [Arsukibacterium sp.]|uniref:carbohydrate kinase family protein n=1 Tax=Arsukibacterium sp. TaxID=1977258 RepID=UPI001BD2CB3F|nr:carbohydrate kinase [Arsukibacterium sp.]
MLKLHAFGEVLIDFLQNPAEPAQFQRFAGGAPANVAVAFSRLGGKAAFIGMLGQDMFGDFLLQSLAEHGVETAFCQRTDDAKTALAFVALDQYGERHFSFYRPPAADLLFRPAHFSPDCFIANSIWHICSNSLTEPAISESTFYGLQQARKAGALISVDANLRHNLWPAGMADRQLVTQVLLQADVVKLSNDELAYLADGNEPAYCQQLLDAGVQWLVVTAAGAAVRSITAYGEQQLAVPTINVVDTTAAGDAFVAGWLLQLAQRLDTSHSLTELLRSSDWQHAILQFAIRCGAFACQRQGAFASLPRLAANGTLV